MRFLFYLLEVLLKTLLCAILSIMIPSINVGQPQYARHYITVVGKKMSYEGFNLKNRRLGTPLLIFEGGFGVGGAEDFKDLFPALSKISAGIGYDRNGVGESEVDSTLVTDRDLVQKLHLFLKTLHLPPPYILIGHSLVELILGYLQD